jgi:hypothetical protein
MSGYNRSDIAMFDRLKTSINVISNEITFNAGFPDIWNRKQSNIKYRTEEFLNITSIYIKGLNESINRPITLVATRELLQIPENYKMNHREVILLDISSDIVNISPEKGEFTISTKKLRSEYYYRLPIEDDLGFIIRKLNENSIELYEYFESKSGRIIIHKLLEVETKNE